MIKLNFLILPDCKVDISFLMVGFENLVLFECRVDQNTPFILG